VSLNKCFVWHKKYYRPFIFGAYVTKVKTQKKAYEIGQISCIYSHIMDMIEYEYIMQAFAQMEVVIYTTDIKALYYSK
jgi:hypothetical protein